MEAAETENCETIDTIDSMPEEVTEPEIAEYVAVQYEDVKAMWLSQYDLEDIYLDGNIQRSEMDFTNRMAEVLDNIVSQGFNTVFLQVRANADSMYPLIPLSDHQLQKLPLSGIISYRFCRRSPGIDKSNSP